MSDLVQRLRFDATRCEAQFSKGVATNIEDAAAEIEWLRARIKTLEAQGRELRHVISRLNGKNDVLLGHQQSQDASK